MHPELLQQPSCARDVTLEFLAPVAQERYQPGVERCRLREHPAFTNSVFLLDVRKILRAISRLQPARRGGAQILKTHVRFAQLLQSCSDIEGVIPDRAISIANQYLNSLGSNRRKDITRKVCHTLKQGPCSLHATPSGPKCRDDLSRTYPKFPSLATLRVAIEKTVREFSVLVFDCESKCSILPARKLF
jgi:hypothetical protein